MMPRQSILLKILLPVIVLLTVWLLLRPASKNTAEKSRPVAWQR
ncbi:hypothetical protein [Citrobacter pasteurii]